MPCFYLRSYLRHNFDEKTSTLTAFKPFVFNGCGVIFYAFFLSILFAKKSPVVYIQISDICYTKTRPFMDKSINSILVPFADGKQPFLTDLFVDDKAPNEKNEKKKQTWDDRKNMSVQVSDILLTGNLVQQNQAKRMRECSDILQFGFLMDSDGFAKPPFKFTLKNAQFCRVPTCPICQQRRAMKWTSRFFEILPRIYADHPTIRYAFLTLTVQNCHVSELRETKKHMNKALKRMTERKAFPALGYVCSFETSKEQDLYDKKTGKLIRKARPDYCHPHFHILLALPSSYFNGRNYMKKDDWAVMWQSALKVDYKPVCDIRMVKSQEVESIPSLDSGHNNQANEAAFKGMMAAIVETIKYTVKPSDMVQDSTWFLEVAKQLHGTRAVSLGGIFKEYLNAADIGNDLILDSEKTENSGGYYFGWRNQVKRYQYIQPKTETEENFDLPAVEDNQPPQDSETETIAKDKFAREAAELQRAYLERKAAIPIQNDILDDSFSFCNAADYVDDVVD